jgi:drug/metabolite transporter (DMT)-like permease
MNTLLLTAFALFAFAGNSLLCRAALGADLIDPVSFTTIRLLSGAIVLALLTRIFPARRRESAGRGDSAPLDPPSPGGPRKGYGGLRTRDSKPETGSWLSALALFVYAAAFSLAYDTLDAGTGALILFASVQAAMMGAAWASGERPSPVQWTGWAAASGGLVWLLWPGLSAPDPLAALLMGVAGVAWGAYSVRGRAGSAPLPETAGNFLRSAPFALVASGVALYWVHLRPTGLLLALGSGAVASGLGYVLWAAALKRLTTGRASAVQLLVPVLAALGGAAFLSEPVTGRLAVAGAIVLGGVALAVRKRGTGPKPNGVEIP